MLCSSPTYVDFNGLSKDISATIDCISACGAVVSTTETGVLVTPPSNFGSSASLNCGESGSTLRFMLPVLSALFGEYSVCAEGRLAERPLAELIGCLAGHGASFSRNSLPLTGSGRLHAGEFTISGNVSSQYISGLMFALPLLSGDSKIVLSSKLSSALYVEMTIATLAEFGIVIEPTDYGFFVKGAQQYVSPKRIFAEGDWSGATFWLCAGAVSGPITVTGLMANSLQPDRKILQILEKIGASIEISEREIRISRGENRGVAVDIDEAPDLMPVLSMLMSFSTGASLIYNGARLRHKESDRISAMVAVMDALAIPTIEGADFLAITGKCASSGTADGANDHRIIMAAALACLHCPVTINGAQAIDKSYPSFFEDFTALGGTHKII